MTKVPNHDYLYNVINTVRPKWIESILKDVDEKRGKPEAPTRPVSKKMSESMFKELEDYVPWSN